LRKFATKEMSTGDVRVAVGLNQYLWSQGIRNPPRRVRFQLSRKRNEDKGAKEQFYTLCSHVPMTREELRGKVPMIVKEQA
jgi:large subunit ribosomal protein L31e